MLAIPFMDFRFENKIDHIPCAAGIDIPHAPEDRIDKLLPGRQLAFEMPSVLSDAARRFHESLPRGKDGLRIVTAARL